MSAVLHHEVVRRGYSPEPPTEDEKYAYLGPVRRWPHLMLFAAQGLVLVVVATALSRSRLTAPALLGLAVVVPLLIQRLRLGLSRRRLTLERHITFVEDWRRQTGCLPSVDVFVLVAGRPLALLDQTLDLVTGLEWPGEINLYVVVERPDPIVADLADNHCGMLVIGGIAEAAAASCGDLITVLTAGAVPRSDLLWETVPYFYADEVAAVAIGTALRVDGSHARLARGYAAIRAHDQRWLQSARDGYGTPTLAPANRIYRRTALVTAGRQCPTRFVPLVLSADPGPGGPLRIAADRVRTSLTAFSSVAPRSSHRRLAALVPLVSGVLTIMVGLAGLVILRDGLDQEWQPRALGVAVVAGWLAARALTPNWTPWAVVVRGIHALADSRAVAQLIAGSVARPTAGAWANGRRLAVGLTAVAGIAAVALAVALIPGIDARE